MNSKPTSRIRRRHRHGPARLTAAGLGLLAATAPGVGLAYVGPGAGLGAFGTVVALLAAFLLMLVGFVWYPVKRLLRRKNGRGRQPDPSSPDDPDEGA